MDVKQTVKINSLVNEFKKHGIAKDEEAIRQATKVVSRGASSQLEMEEINQETLDIINRKISYSSELNERRIKEETDKIRAEIGNILAELRALRDSVKNMGNRVVVEQKPEEKGSEEQETKSEEKPKPRTGDYQPGDVDINKVFYFGKK